MRRTIVAIAVLAMLMFAGTSTALARGPHHGGGPGRGPGHHHHYYQRYGNSFNSFYRGPIGPACGIRQPIVAYPVYPRVTTYPYVPAYPQLGFGIGGRNFSFFYQQ